MSGIDSGHLKQLKEVILFAWEERCLKEVSAAVNSASLALRNSLPIYLDHLSEALATNRKMDFRSVFRHDQEAVRIGRLHGADRAGNRSYLLTEVIFEYHILREVIFQVLEKDGALAVTSRDIILDSIEQAVNDAAVEFSDINADIQQKFINTLTHDLKNPITAALTNAELISLGKDLPPAVITNARRIMQSLHRLDAMIHNLLDASRVRAGEQLALQYIECDPRTIIGEVVDEMTLIHGERFTLSAKEPAAGNWGSDGLRRAFENLIGNAVKYSAPDTPITVSLKRGELGVELTVHNLGTPIAEAEIPLLFQQYRRSKSALEGSKSGWGLGLTLVKGMVDAHKGKVRVESSLGKGTSFIMELPFAPVMPPELPINAH